MQFSSRLAVISALSLALLLAIAGCSTQSSQAIGEAYIAPASINVRGELNQKNSSVAVLKHGDRVDIIDVRRRFIKVRTAKGVEGWVDATQLLSPEQMDQIRHERQRALALPSEGSATVFEALNIHIDPNRTSPAFVQIPEGGSVAVLAHRLEPKTVGSARPQSLTFERPQPPSRRQRNQRQSKNNYRLPPMPPPPKPPSNWQELSAGRIGGAESTADIKANEDKQASAKRTAELKKPVVMEDWTLVRTKGNQSGWVLSRNLMMSIPDEVAQYAEGKRITSYFDLGSVNDDRKGLKHNWLWTTSSTPEAYDFDSWRVFLWNRHHHRYETSYRARDLEGYFPVNVDPPNSSRTHLRASHEGRRWKISTAYVPVRWSAHTLSADGKLSSGINGEHE